MELFKILGTIAVTNADANDAIDETTGKAENSADKVGSAFSKIGKAALAVGKVIAVGMGVAITAIGALTAQSVQAYADYEQLVGGIETLFGDAQDTVMGYAKEAFRTAGMSANEYMETVTGFSASLIQSLEGDTQEAAEKANQAILDMSDNANKMGTAIGSIQDAYQGFAKQNYTMLDNLKLGYGGTKEEMERLLADAEKLSGVKYDISSYADIVDAIHVVQTEMGITGTTAEEASKTISGSVSSMKAAWSNLVTGLGDDNADLSALIDTFVESLLISADNVLPRIEKILGGISDLVVQLVPKIAEKLPGMLQTVLPALLQGVVALFTSLVSALPGLLQILLEQMPFIMTEICSALETTLPLLLSSAEEIFGQLFSFIFNDLLGTELDVGGLFSSLNEVILTISESLMPLIPVLVSFATDLVAQLMPLVEELLPIVADLLLIIVPLVVDLVPKITETVTLLITSLMPTLLNLCNSIQLYVLPALEVLVEWLGPIIMDTIDNVSRVLEGLAQIFSGIMEFIVSTVEFWLAIFQGDWSGALDATKNQWSALWDIVLGILKTAFTGIIGLVTKNWDKIKNFFLKIWDWVVEAFEFAKENVINVFENIYSKIQDNIEAVKKVFGGLIDNLKNVFAGNWEEAWNGIVNSFKGIINLIPTILESNINAAVGIINGMINGINKLTGTIGITAIPNIPEVDIPPFLAEGGVLERGQVGILEGNGAEAVVPLENNKKWIASLSRDMQAQGIGGGAETKAVLEEILAVLKDLRASNTRLPDTLVDAIAGGLRLDINNREFARMVKAVN